jgi:hypothetical protein
MARQDASHLHGPEHVRAYRETDGELGHDWRNGIPEEKPAMWQEMVRCWPSYDDYQRRTDREIPVVVLERA